MMDSVDKSATIPLMVVPTLVVCALRETTVQMALPLRVSVTLEHTCHTSKPSMLLTVLSVQLDTTAQTEDSQISPCNVMQVITVLVDLPVELRQPVFKIMNAQEMAPSQIPVTLDTIQLAHVKISALFAQEDITVLVRELKYLAKRELSVLVT